MRTGFAAVTLANAIGGSVMLIMIPFAVLATKRLDTKNRKTDVKQQDVSYTGAVGEGASPNKVMLPPLAQSTPMM